MWYAWWGILKFRFDIYTQNRYLKNQFLWFIIRSYQYDSWMYTILIAYASARMTIYQFLNEDSSHSNQTNKYYIHKVCVCLFSFIVYPQNKKIQTIGSFGSIRCVQQVDQINFGMLIFLWLILQSTIFYHFVRLIHNSLDYFLSFLMHMTAHFARGLQLYR